ncbi:MAG: hypothetical protein M3546_04435 [Actinomycetota bacterium]|nr:hypothetical protein [Actinomycetota bacterium]
MERTPKLTKRVHEQIEKVIDEGTGERRSVIVRMAEPEDDVTTLGGIATDAIRTRRLCRTAREILPSSIEAVRGKEPGKLSRQASGARSQRIR